MYANTFIHVSHVFAMIHQETTSRLRNQNVKKDVKYQETEINFLPATASVKHTWKGLGLFV